MLAAGRSVDEVARGARRVYGDWTEERAGRAELDVHQYGPLDEPGGASGHAGRAGAGQGGRAVADRQEQRRRAGGVWVRKL